MPGIARPGALVAIACTLHGVLALPPAILFLQGTDQPIALVAWGIGGLLTAGPTAFGLAIAAAARERALYGLALAGRPLWLGYAVGGLVIAHWVPMLAWSPIALLASTSGHADDHLASALVGLVAWVTVAAGLGLVAWTRWVMEGRVHRTVVPLFGERPEWLASAALFAVMSTPATSAVVVALAEGRASVAVAESAVVALLALGLLAASGLAWSAARADGERARRGRRIQPFATGLARALAGLLFVQFGVVFGMTLLTGWGDALGSRLVLQAVAGSVLVVAAGVLGAMGTGLREMPLAR
jgi:hypothetical protein